MCDQFEVGTALWFRCIMDKLEKINNGDYKNVVEGLSDDQKKALIEALQ
ncbi:hypothetical protein SAMN04244559_01103 [Magnetospirillum fulvum]|uniref:Uncharacterized protein n=1 Tax=Magnetospirillum fulvum TaxID=1082 RepID=A0A1H6HAI9_MAGFU|nr:hypothetical protein SAMN04244559_01103 [Magnetospirillum fulvum]